MGTTIPLAVNESNILIIEDNAANVASNANFNVTLPFQYKGTGAVPIAASGFVLAGGSPTAVGQRKWVQYPLTVSNYDEATGIATLQNTTGALRATMRVQLFFTVTGP